MTIKEFIRECHEREVFKMLSIYVVTSWVILQVLSVTWQPLGFPETSVTYLILILIIGLPIYIFYIWRSRLKHQVSNDPDDAVEVKNRRVFERFFFTGFGIISFFCAMSILLIVNNSFGNNNALPEFSSVDRIAVLQFENDTGNEKFDFVSKMSADWITHGITDSKVGQVITSEIINEYTEMARSSSAGLSGIDILKSYLKPAKIISGSIFLNGDDLIFRCSVLDGTTNEVLISLNPVNCPTGRPLDCIEEIRQRILGYLSFVDKPELNLQKNPPTFESYQYLMEAKELGAFDSIYPVLLDKAIQADSTNWEALAFKVMYYYNIDDYKKADSLRKAILPKSGLSDRQRNLMNHFNALFIGNNWNAYAYHLEEYKLAPFDFITNRSQMVLALQYINNPEIVDEFYEAINMGELNFQDCQECVNRMYLKALADIEKEEYYKVIDLLEEKALLTNNFWLLRPLIMAYVRTNSFESLEKVLNRLKLMGSTDWEEANTVAGKEILRFYEPDQAMKYFQAVKENSPDKESQRYARSLYYMQDYKQAEPLLKAIIDKEPDGFRNRAYHAISLYKNNKTDEAKAAIKALNEMRKELQFGAIDYAIAQFYASIGEKDIALEHLMNSIANGNYYSPETFQNDYHLRDLVDLPEFNLIMNFWNN